MQLRTRRPWSLFVLPLIVLFAPVAAPAGDKIPEPSGFDKAKFGMNEAQVKALYPEVKEPVMPTPQPGEPAPFLLTMFTLENQSIGPLKKCKVTLRFFQHELADVRYACAEDEAKVYSYLEKRFGTPKEAPAKNTVSWVGTTTSTTEMRRTGTFMFSDLARNQKMSSLIMAYMVKKGQPILGTPQTPGAPAVTPEAGK